MELPQELEEYRDAVDALHAIAHVRWAILGPIGKEVQEQEGIPLEWFEVLVLLLESPDQSLRMNDLASFALRSKSGMTRLFDRIEEAGLARRDLSTTDRRVVLAVLTDNGRALLDRVTPTVARIMIERFGSHVSPVEAQQLVTTLNRVLERNNVNPDSLPGGRTTQFQRASH